MAEFTALPVEANKFFPSHGYTTNVGGFKQIRLPLLQLCKYGSPTYGAYEKKGVSPNWVQARSPVVSLRMLVLCLKDLSSELEVIRQGLQLGWNPEAESEARHEAITRKMMAQARAEILLLGAFVLLRRVADQIVEIINRVRHDTHE